MENDTIKSVATVHALRKHQVRIAQEINQDGIWLFLATIGCVSLTDLIMRGMALFIGLFLVLYIAYVSVDESRMDENAAMADAVENAKARNEIVGPLLDDAEKEYSGFLSAYTKCWPFTIALLFWMYCLVETMLRLCKIYDII